MAMGINHTFRVNPNSAPGVTGQIVEGNTITVNSDGTNNYGGGAVSTIFECRGTNGVDGVGLGVNDPEVGTLSNVGNAEWTNEVSHSNGVSMVLFDSDTAAIEATPYAVWTGASSEVAISFFIRNEGTYMPNTTGGVDGDNFPVWGDSVGKICWAMLTGDGHLASNDEPDIACPTLNMAIDGNESSMHQLNFSDPGLKLYHDFGVWSWWVTLLDGADQFGIRWRAHNSTTGFDSVDAMSPTDADGFWGTISSGNRNFDRCSLCSTIRSTLDPVRIFIDDLMVQSGAGAGCFVVIGDASTLNACTNISVLKVTNATNTALTAVVRNGPFSSLTGKYIFAIDKNMAIANYSGSEGRLIS